MAVRPAVPERPESGRTPESVLALTRQLLAELHPGARVDPPGHARQRARARPRAGQPEPRGACGARRARLRGSAAGEGAGRGRDAARPARSAAGVRRRISSAAAPAPRRRAGPSRRRPCPHDAATLVEALDWHVRAHPDRVHIVYRRRRRRDAHHVSAICTGRSRSSPPALQRQGLEPRQTVAIMLPTGPEYFHTYFGILLRGRHSGADLSAGAPVADRGARAPACGHPVQRRSRASSSPCPRRAAWRGCSRRAWPACAAS